MPTIETLIAFTVVSAGIIAIPGPSNLFILGHGIGHGRRSAVAALVGVEAASAIRILLTAVGLSALLASSAIALDVIRWAGGAYLLYLGIRAFRARRTDQLPHPVATALPARRAAGKGFAVALGNPKMVIFFVAFFPQYIHPAVGSRVTQTFILGAIFWVLGLLWDVALAAASGTLGEWLRQRPRAQTAQSRVEGATYIGLAGWAAVT